MHLVGYGLQRGAGSARACLCRQIQTGWHLGQRHNKPLLAVIEERYALPVFAKARTFYGGGVGIRRRITPAGVNHYIDRWVVGVAIAAERTEEVRLQVPPGG